MVVVVGGGDDGAADDDDDDGGGGGGGGGETISTDRCWCNNKGASPLMFCGSSLVFVGLAKMQKGEGEGDGRRRRETEGDCEKAEGRKHCITCIEG